MDLFSSLSIKSMELSNRIVLPPLASSYATEEGSVTKRHISHYSRFKGLGLIILEHTYVHPKGKYSKGQLGLYSDDQIEGLGKLVESIKSLGSRVVLQLSHAGGVGVEAKAPSSVNQPKREGVMPEELTREEMLEIRGAFVEATRRALLAGFDSVEIHGAHGFLLSQFLSPLTNKREDAYGGTWRDRLRFPLEVVEAVKEVLPEEVPLFYRLGAYDGIEGGLDLEESSKMARELVEKGVDLLDLSGGLGGYPQDSKEEGFFLNVSDSIKPEVDVPVLLTGGFKTPEIANQMICEGRVDLIGVGRQLLKDPDWALKAKESLQGP